MDLNQYLQQRENILKNRIKNIKDLKVFDFNYLPPQPLLREEIKPIIDALLKYDQTKIPTNLAIFGSRGSGKTIMLKFLKKTLDQKTTLTFLYVNVRNANTTFKILAEILHLKPRGISLNEMFEKFTQRYPNKTVIILDEIDLLSPKDKNKEILYLLSRSKNNYMTIMLSNNARFLNEIDQSTKSTLQPQIIHFKNYDSLQMYKILKQRAKTGLKQYKPEQLQQISALTVKNTSGDVRVAIKTLFYLATGEENVVEDCFEKAKRDIYIDLIQDLNDKNLLILRAAQKAEKNNVKEVYSIYIKNSEEFKEQPYSYVYFYNNLSYLQSLGLILLASAKLHRTYTNRIALLFNPKILDNIFKNRFY